VPAPSSALERLSRRFRRRRMQRFLRAFPITPQTRILDVGGTPDDWQMLPVQPRLVLLNMPRARADMSAAAEWVGGDGRALPFRDQSFDIVFSNSVIEHVGDAASQQRFAAEIARVGRAFWVQTPNHWFPVEQHLLTPLLHWLPKPVQGMIAPRVTVWAIVTRPSPDRRQFYIEHFLRDIRLLTARQFQQLFPAATIIRERFAGVTKSLIAVKKN
jgi:Methyltransferase domain